MTTPGINNQNFGNVPANMATHTNRTYTDKTYAYDFRKSGGISIHARGTVATARQLGVN